MIFYTIGQLVLLESVLLLLPCVTALVYAEYSCALSYFAVAAGAAVVGFALTFLLRKADRTIYAREGLVTVALAWVVLSAIGALPFVLSGDIPSYVDAFFEIVSGFTTTGASILPNVEALTHGALFWRSFSHWIGGMGVLVLMMAIMPNGEGRSIHIIRAEMPGPKVDKIVPKVRETAKILYLIYIALTIVEVIFLLFGGMSLFEALLHAFGTAGTGGFGLKGDSLASYSTYIKWVVAIFMLIFGVNFNIYYFILIKKFSQALKSEELHVFLGIVLVSSGIITANILKTSASVGSAVTDAVFQVSSIITTTGFSSVDFDLWPQLSKTVLFLLMFIGGCAGSTAGGLKVSRVIIMYKSARRELRRILHPRSVSSLKFEGKTVDSEAEHGVLSYFAMYFIVFALLLFLLCLEPLDFETNVTAVTACYNNIGPGFAGVGPMASFAGYSDFSKLVLSAAMLLGRLELYPLLLTFAPSTWAKK